MKNIIFLISLLLVSNIALSQVAINYDGSQPTPHTILDIKSDSTGLLIPRMTTVQRNILSGKLNSSHEGMIIFDKTGNYLFFWNGSNFEVISSGTISEIEDSDYDTFIDVESGTDPDDIIIGTGGTIYWILKNGRLEITNTGNSVFIGDNAGTDDDLSDNNNVFIGYNAGTSNINGYNNVAVGSNALATNGESSYYSNSSANNVAVGYNSLWSNTSGYNNSAVGSEAMFSNSSGQRNNAFGYKALYANSTGYDNVAIGNEALIANQTGYYNVVVGADALKTQSYGYQNIAIGKSSLYNSNNAYYNVAIGASSLFNSNSGNGNIAIGYQAGYYNIDGAMNVFIGYLAGFNETGSDKLYIDNSNTSSPLIYGDFDSNILSPFGYLGINTKTPVGELHVHSTDKTHNIIYVTPQTAGSGDSTSVFLAEDDDASYGMYWMYDGSGNQMELWGKSNITEYGPHIIVDRNDGDVSIGDSFATGYKLSVAGKVICEELRVNLQTNWPDYVFTENYKLLPVDDLENFIQDKGHLPNIPSAAEMEESGLDVGETQRLMMEKIEELTLYIIQQQKQIEELKNEINNLKR